MKILLIGTGESYHVGAFFRNALNSSEYPYMFIDDRKYVATLNRSSFQKLIYRINSHPPVFTALNREIVAAAQTFAPDITLITQGSQISPKTLRTLTDGKSILINFATDDPFNPRVSSRYLLAGIPEYDLYVCTKRAIMEDVRRAGCPNVAYVAFGYEPSLHYPEEPVDDEERERFSSDVLFIGAADTDRYPILREVAAIPNIQLHLYGGYWDHDPILKPFHRGLVYGRDYRLALSGTKIAICLVRRANRDGHVMRTFETPACGAFMLAERTEEHLEFFTEGEEMACFGSNEELVEKIRYYLAHDEERHRIAEAGYRKVRASDYTYKDRLVQILTLAKGIAR